MARPRGGHDSSRGSKAGTFFMATLVLRLVSVWFEIAFNGRNELVVVVSGCLFFQVANWVVRKFLPRDPLLVNTAMSPPPFFHHLGLRQLDMLPYRLYSGWIPSILLHHLILLICFPLALYRNVTINYLILTLICELHSIFLHVRKVRYMAGIHDAKSLVVKVEWILNWSTFLVARLASHILVTAKLIIDARKFEKGV